MKTLTKYLSIILLFSLLFSCGKKNQPVNFDYGHVENNSYINSYFGFKIDLPSGWIVQSKEQTAQIAENGKKLVAGDDEKLNAALKASEVNVANLLAVFQYELGSAVEYNPNIMMVAENIKAYPGIKKGSDYLFQARKLIQQGQFKYDYLSEQFKSETISGIEFYTMEGKINYMNLDIKQIYYSTVLKGFCLSIIISYVSDEQYEILKKSLNSLSFKS
jgi:hypothetical protein